MVRRLIFLAVIAAVIALLLRIFVIEGIFVASASMEPTFAVGRQLFLEKIVLKFREPKRGEVIVFPSPVKKGKDLVKRVIALPGDTVEIKDKVVFLNGEKLNEMYVQFTRPYERLKGDNIKEITIPEGMVFVMGDNRDESNDSRDWIDPALDERIMFISINSIKGRVISTY